MGIPYTALRRTAEGVVVLRKEHGSGHCHPDTANGQRVLSTAAAADSISLIITDINIISLITAWLFHGQHLQSASGLLNITAAASLLLQHLTVTIPSVSHVKTCYYIAVKQLKFDKYRLVSINSCIHINIQSPNIHASVLLEGFSLSEHGKSDVNDLTNRYC